MPAWNVHETPEVFLSTDDISPSVSRAVKKGLLRRIAPRLYTTNTTDPPEMVVRRNLWRIAGLLFPGAVIGDRTAFENAPAPDGSVFLVGRANRDVQLPGLTLRTRNGPGPLPGDQPFLAGLHLASPARAYLENMRPARARKGMARRLPRRTIEQRLDDDLRTRGEGFLNALRDQARQIAPPLGLVPEGSELERIIGTILGSRTAPLESRRAEARAAGRPFDPARVELFALLRAELARVAAPVRQDPGRPDEVRMLAFFEAYFSNFIEGTEFDVDEANAIVFAGTIPRERPEDAHDVLGTYQVVSDAREMAKTPDTADALLALLRSRHAQVMAARPDRRPGGFKQRPNRAGATLFVEPPLVEGTLREGFDVYRTIPEPFHRAVFISFLVSETHPFVDGNGRVARIMMNAELVAAGERRIIVPTVYRTNYLAGLKALSQNRQPAPIVRILDFAQRYTTAIDFSDYTASLSVLRETNAFLDPQLADQEGLRLRLPA